MSKQEKKEFQNPIDKDKITENPHSLPYAYHVGSIVIKPVDIGKVKGKAMTAMKEQTHIQMEQIRRQVELLALQAQEIQKRVEVSEKIYLAEMGFEPSIGEIYHLYEKSDESWVLSLVGPNEWGRKIPYTSFVSSVKMLADHTWELLKSSSESE
ncbi:MAG: DUF2452 domain-containing protein [Bacteroidetes bacterium]|nr:DUF2452 domain-containing protein [Bacteroidota bacterium]